MTVRRTLVWAAVAAVFMALLVLSASSSHAETSRLLVGSSASGPFQDNLSRPLFTGDMPLVPRDDVTRRFWVKNNSGVTARATLAVVDRGTSNAFEDALTFEVDIEGVESAGPVAVPDDCQLITTGPSLGPGDVQAIDVRLLVADLRRQVGVGQGASLDFVVTLSELGSQGQVEVCGEQAVADPDRPGEPAGTDVPPAECERDVVVTVAGPPTCVPTVVDAGRASPHGGGPVRDPGVVGLASLILLGTGGLALLLGRRRRSS